MQINLSKYSKIAIISDTHLGGKVTDQVSLLKVLDSVEFVIFNGDIFELYVDSWEKAKTRSDGAWLYQWMVDNPDKFVYVYGNHDLDIVQGIKPFRVYPYVSFSFQGKSVLVIHGHQFDKLNREPSFWVKAAVWIEYLINWVFHLNIKHNFVERNTTLGRVAKDKKQKYIDDIRRESVKYLMTCGHDILIHGHSHESNILKVEDKIVYDQGDFVSGTSYILISDKIELIGK